MPDANVYRNAAVGATPNPLMPVPDEHDETFARAANSVLERTVELARVVVPAHQSAAAVIVGEDWSTIRKFFSLSPKYAAWDEYRTPAAGYGIHAWLLRQDRVVRLSAAELESHPEWKGFGTEAGAHPPMRGWLAAPIVDSVGTNWGLLQLSDRVEGEFTFEDETHLVQLAELASTALEALWDLRNARVAR